MRGQDTVTQEAGLVLEARGLTIAFRRHASYVEVVRNVDLSIAHGEIVGLVGESGSGKSIFARAILGTLPSQAEVLGGEVDFDGRDLLRMPRQGLQRLRGDRIALVPQEPMTSLNPSLRIGRQLTEVLEVHRPEMPSAARVDSAVAMLDLVGIKFPRERLAQYPHQLSGGLRQRVAIAMALICGRVELLIADEPTSALDVSVQAQILNLLSDLQKELGVAYLFITHNFGVVEYLAHDIAVMKDGKLVEYGAAEQVLTHPQHSYTQALLRAVPRLARRA